MEFERCSLIGQARIIYMFKVFCLGAPFDASRFKFGAVSLYWAGGTIGYRNIAGPLIKLSLAAGFHRKAFE